MLAGVDLSRPAAQVAASEAAARVQASPDRPGLSDQQAAIICPHEDCGQSNPAGATTCLYCNRPLADDTSLTKPAQLHSLVSLPAALKDRYRIVQPLPTRGAEAELLLVQDTAGGANAPIRVAKIYRGGIQPRLDVQARVARVDAAHRVEVLQSGVSDGYAFELMEYCQYGSLRDYLRAHAPAQSPAQLGEFARALVRELASAIVGVHAAGLLHRDLKPENILVRETDPLDLVLADFGTSSMLDATQRFTSTARTLPYASPESLSGVIDGKADFWSLGMILLEVTLGKHPFAGLSEAVILHHLTTRNIDLSAVTDAPLRKLLRGLLLRDPKQRWGKDEIARWLANDPTLTEANEPGISAGFREPYHVGKETCYTNEQLAVALARNWQVGVGDLLNGLLLAWFRDVQKDQNAIRILIELRFEKQLPVDAQLLKFILHLAPGIPPVWRGESIELPAILGHADRALKGDEAAEEWLDRLYRYRVLESYAAAGNQDAADIVQKWNRACDQFVDARAAGLALINAKAPERDRDEIVNFDQLVFGEQSHALPAFDKMHARLLAIAYDAQWAERLRKRLVAELAELTVYCPWFADLDDTQRAGPAALLVLEALLPEARKIRDRQIKFTERQRESAVNELQSLKHALSLAGHALRATAKGGLIMGESRDALRLQLQEYFSLLAQVKESERSDIDWQTLKKSAARNEAIARQMSLSLDRLAERLAVDAGWFSPPMIGLTLLVSLALPFAFKSRLAYFPLVASLVIAAWRISSTLTLARKIGASSARIST
jgi:tRNA A-37 threonylcarbamoyl transferase component Bud32